MTSNAAHPPDEEIYEPSKEVIPEGVTHNHPGIRSFPIDALWPYAKAGRWHQNTFEVEPSHTRVPCGVCFNVETVPEPLQEHRRKSVLQRSELIQNIKKNTAVHYNNVRRVNESECDSFDRVRRGDIRLEAVSNTQGENLVHLGTDGFVMALVTAFAQHLPLTLSPDHLFIVISHAFAAHVEKHSEELRHHFAQHDGKKRLLVETQDGFQMSTNNDPDTGALAEDWEEQIFPAFSTQIRAQIGEKAHQAVAADFTTTTPAIRAAHEITLMAAMKNYCSYGFVTRCGIPNITLLGTDQDWILLRVRTEQLGELMLPEFSDYWMPLLLPILDEFVASYQGSVNHGFWQSMVKLRETGGGSGSHDFISGWMQILFPYNADGDLNRHLRPWHEMYFQGPEITDFPPILSSAAVDWKSVGTTYDLSFHAGILGFTQDPSTGALSPHLGWYVSHVPPRSIARLLEDHKKELEGLLLAHSEEDQSKNNPWHERVKYLQERLVELEEERQLEIEQAAE